MDAKNRLYLLRTLKIFVLVGIPLLGLLYAYQFTGQSREEIVPFQVFKAPETATAAAFSDRVTALDFSQAPLTVVNFWATWCPPCVEEFPAMVELERQLKPFGVRFVFISVDDGWAPIQKFVKEFNLQVPAEELFLDQSKELANRWGSVRFPETYVVRRDGWVVEKIIGAQQWTRPAVIRYFSALAEKSSRLKVSRHSPFSLFPEAFAQESRSSSVLHEDDKKNLDKLRANIDTASKNLRSAEAALRDEKRNLEEQRVVLERKVKDENEARKEVDKLEGKRREVKTILQKNTDSQNSEKSERKRSESRIKDIQDKIKELQRELEDAKSKLVQANKDLNTRIQQIETYEEARKSSEEELGELEKKLKYAEKIRDERTDVVKQNKSEVSSRESHVRELERSVSKAQKSLDEQKTKLKDFEKILDR